MSVPHGRQDGHIAHSVSARFYAKGFDGRIDDPNAGWKHIQLRPDPLAR